MEIEQPIDMGWLQDNCFSISDLSNMKNMREWKALNNHVEETMGLLAERHFRSRLDGNSIGDRPRPEYDVSYMNGLKLEIKLTTLGTPWIETGRIEKTGFRVSSGLSASKANYYMILRKSYLDKEKKDVVYKVHIIPTETLVDCWDEARAADKETVKHSNQIGFSLNLKNIEDGIIGYFEACPNDPDKVNLDTFNIWNRVSAGPIVKN